VEKAPKLGNNWDCWIGIGKLGKIDGSVGIVETRISNELIDSMEAHGKPELLIPIDEPIIQPVAASNGTEKPDAKNVEAFIIYPGQSIVLKEYTWHCAAIPLESDSWYYFVGNSVWDGPGTSENPWITFKNDLKIKIL
jgi:ureidoglycolate hydrolase